MSTTPQTFKILLKTATPPFKAFADADLDRTLSDLGIKHGDSYLIDSGAQSAGLTQSSAPFSVKMVRRVIADDNSCLFNSVGYVLLSQAQDQAMSLRLLVADTVRSNPSVYTAAFLGTTPSDYCNQITMPKVWGGAIELAIFADHFKTEIVSIDVETAKPYLFGEGKGYEERVFVLYSGIHYDALAQPLNNRPDKTIFSTDEDVSFKAALLVAEEERKAHRYTNTNNFSLQCSICRTALVGQTEAQVYVDMIA
jgi:ubiquitin thioesterase OTU1